jgi:hypothetical protein
MLNVCPDNKGENSITVKMRIVPVAAICSLRAIPLVPWTRCLIIALVLEERFPKSSDGPLTKAVPIFFEADDWRRPIAVFQELKGI